MLDPFTQLFQHCWGHARSLRMDYKDLWVVFFPRCAAGPKLAGSCCVRLHAALVTRFFGGNVVRVLVHFSVSLPLIFTLHSWSLPFLILSAPLQNFHVVLPAKKCLLCFFFFYISRPRSLSPYFSLSFACLPPTFSFPLSFSCSTFLICGHDN